MLHLLPLEIVEEIVYYIGVGDIDSLLSIPTLEKRLGDKILLVEEFEDPVEEFEDLNLHQDRSEDVSINSVEESDDEVDLMASDDESMGTHDEYLSTETEIEDISSKYGLYFTNITHRFKLKDLKHDLQLFNNFICVIIISEDSTNLEKNLQIPKQPVHKKYFYTGVDPDGVELTLESFEYACELKYGNRDTFEFSTYDVLFDSFEWNPTLFRFNQLETLRFMNTIIQPLNIEGLPKLTYLVLEDCDCSQVSSKWHLPSLKVLQVIGKYKTIEPLIDFQTTGIQRLLLEDIVDMDSWCNISNSSLLEISVSFIMGPNHKMELINLNFQSVVTLIVEADSILISGLEAPHAKVFKLTLSSEHDSIGRSQDTLRSIKAPELEYLSILGGSFEAVMGIDIPIWEACTEVPRTTS